MCRCRTGVVSGCTVPFVPTDEECGYVLHNLETGVDYSAETEAQALALTGAFGADDDWSLWKVRRDGGGKPSMVAVGCGPVPTQ
ncbi:MAG: hypothetical protein NVS3B21_11030 [Acidimicrobiales bacterium]